MEDKVRQAKRKRREVKAFEFSLNQIKEASESSLKNLNRLKTQISKGQDDDLLNSTKIHVSNEAKKLSNILKDLETLKKQIPDEDLELFCDKIKSLQDRVSNELESVINAIECRPTLGVEVEEYTFHDAVEEAHPMSQVQEITIIKDDNLDLASEVANARAIDQSWNGIRRDLTCLHDMFNSLATIVMEQRSTVESIDCNVQEANDKIRDGARILQKIKKHAALPLLGAAVGTCIAGPIGFVAGFKIGALSCLATGTLGYVSGRAVQTRVNQLPTIDMIANTPCTSQPPVTSPEDNQIADDAAKDKTRCGT